MTNEEIITSIHTALISKPDLPIEAQKAHIFPGVNKALLSIGRSGLEISAVWIDVYTR